MLIRTMAGLALAALIAANADAQHEHAEHERAAPNHGASTMPAMTAPEPTVAAPATGLHGGIVQQAGEMRFEVVVEPGGLRLYAYDHQGKPLDVRAARGVATLQVAGDTKRYRYDLFPQVRQDQSAEQLGVAVDLSQLAGRELDLVFQLAGLSPAGSQPTRFTARLRAPMTKAQQVAAAIAKQKVCPVSGQPLGAMGKPVPVTVNGKTVYVCCESCVGKVKADPAKYFAAKPRLTMAPATAADAQAIAVQKVCPVTNEPLGGMGVPLKVTGLGRDVFLCCKGCLKKLEQDPQKYLAMLPPLPESTKPLAVKATGADAPFVAAQKFCPVMDEPLDGMGGPYRTVVEGRVVYVCCPGCLKKLHADPKAHLEKLAKQGVTPPMAR